MFKWVANDFPKKCSFFKSTTSSKMLNQNVHSHVVMEGGFVQLPQILLSWICCCWWPFITDSTIENHEFFTTIMGEYVYKNVPFAPFSVANLVVDMLDHNGVFVQFFRRSQKKMCLEDWFSYPNDSKRIPKLFWLGVRTESSRFRDSPWWQLKYFWVFTPNLGERIPFDEQILNQMGWWRTTN